MHLSWKRNLEKEIYYRLAQCSTIKEDLIPLVQARWDYIKHDCMCGKDDAIEFIMELLECNGIDFGLTEIEYDEILNQII